MDRFENFVFEATSTSCIWDDSKILCTSTARKQYWIHCWGDKTLTVAYHGSSRYEAREILGIDELSNSFEFVRWKFIVQIEMRRQPASTTANKRPHFKCRKIQHVDVPAWLRRLRIAPSRTSSISTIRSQTHAFAWFAAHNHPTRHALISAAQAGTSYLRIYPAVTDPSIKPISGLYLYQRGTASTLILPASTNYCAESLYLSITCS